MSSNAGKRRLASLILAVAGIVYCFAPQSGAHAAPAPGTDAVSEHCNQKIIDRLKKRSDYGDPDAIYEYGFLEFTGHCVVLDEQSGIIRLHNAADQGHADAAFTLGQIYGDPDLVYYSPANARHYFHIAADHDHGDALHSHGMMLLRRDASLPEREAALLFLGSAASSGHGVSALVMGRLHEVGLFGVTQDLCLARDWYESSVANGLSVAQMHLNRVDTLADCF